MKQHPTMDTLLAYLEDAENVDFADLRLHIATCNNCRSALRRLGDLQGSIREGGLYRRPLAQASEPLRNALARQWIERYLDGELQAPETESVKQLLQSDPLALKAALHYASHGAAGARAAALAQDTTAPGVAPLGRLGDALMKQVKNLLNASPAVWITVPATAAAVLLLTLAAVPGWKSSQGFTLAAYQDKPVIHFQGAGQLPGIGFFNKAFRSTESFGPMEIRHDGRQTLSLQWPAVSNAVSYHLAVYLISEGRKITVKELDLTGNRADLPAFKAQAGKRYEWTLNGDTNDNKSFFTSGGFVINQHQ